MIIILYKTRMWLNNTMYIRYHLIPLLFSLFLFFLIQSFPIFTYRFTLGNPIMASCIPAGWHTFNYVKHYLTYREKDTADRLIEYYERRRNFSLLFQLIKWGIKWVISFIIGVPSVFYLIYKIIQEMKQIKRLKKQEVDV